MQQEIWKDIPGYDGIYQVSNKGRVRSLPRIVKRGNHVMRIQGTIMKFGTSMGYPFVNLRKNGVSVSVKVHKLVAITFIENPLNKPEIDHINANRKDNRVENLQWATRHENSMNPITRERNSLAKRKLK